MGLSVKDQGVIRDAKKVYAKVGGTWNTGKKVFANVSGSWRQVWSNTNVSLYSSIPTGGGGVTGSGMVVVGDYLYSFGGSNSFGSSIGGSTLAAFRMNITSGAWERIADIPSDSYEVIAYYSPSDNKIYLVGMHSSGQATHYAYNIASNSYESLSLTTYSYTYKNYKYGKARDELSNSGAGSQYAWVVNSYDFLNSAANNKNIKVDLKTAAETGYAQLSVYNFAFICAYVNGDIYAFSHLYTGGEAPYYKWTASSNTWAKLGTCPWGAGYSTFDVGSSGRAILGTDGKVYIVIRKYMTNFDVYTFDPTTNTFALLFNITHSITSVNTTSMSPTMCHDLKRSCFWILSPEKIDSSSWKSNIYKLEY